MMIFINGRKEEIVKNLITETTSRFKSNGQTNDVNLVMYLTSNWKSSIETDFHEWWKWWVVE